MMKTLFNLCLSYVARNLETFGQSIDYLPVECNEWLLEWVSSHDLVSQKHVIDLIRNPAFASNLRRINFYMSDEVSDSLLENFGKHNRMLEHIAIVFCTKITERGIQGITKNQKSLNKLELRGIKNFTSAGISQVTSERLAHVDLSENAQLDNSGVIRLIKRNRNIQRLYLNSCKGISDLALYAIGANLGHCLIVLELDFMINISDPSLCLSYLTKKCFLLKQLSICSYFDRQPHLADRIHFSGEINCDQLRELDLYANYLSALPSLPKNLKSIRISLNGSEKSHNFSESLEKLSNLTSLRLVLNCTDAASPAVNNANQLLIALLGQFGHALTGFQVSIPHLQDEVLWLLLEQCPSVSSLTISAMQCSIQILQYLFQEKERALMFTTLKFHRVRLTYKLLVTIARVCQNLTELEVSWIQAVDDRFLRILADNCTNLKCINLNGCSWATDKGVCELARSCPLREIRVRATGCTNKCVYVLAQCCPDLEWISHADYSGRPTFSDEALMVLKDACVQRVIC